VSKGNLAETNTDRETKLTIIIDRFKIKNNRHYTEMQTDGY